MKVSLKYTITAAALFFTVYAFACDACKLRQPEVTRDFTHGTGPESDWDWFIVGIVIVITVLAFVYSLKYLIKPGEKNTNHIKYYFLK
ncbi:hypothetical protein HX13_07170 [Chryseobacterium sp. P1-3]|uniref:Uncharacterized protein n=1 Tax=Chryseobacterium gallinarum TaxID=1324352 RepID=A0A0G3M6R0_CHRGL|nr:MULTISPECIES: hypothetical protein [Chryseobacterium]AKK74559.1 hypothetical protein OK18_19825 [Chryseobacterium gallinarum]KFF75805.1 hypothetical protein HX13_07170 [Chryseobacterium sp. P1-3]MCL8538389.1 hypothetical protein [Chryseobacterium gallinarum]QIY89646.1 hypothetical protein FOB44_02795 [Chryseobacterium gallinarum]